MNDPVLGRKHKVWCWLNWRFTAFCLTTQKLTGNEFSAIKSKLYKFLLLHGFTSNLRHETYICFIARNLDSWTTMLQDHASQWIYNSRITAAFHEFSRFTLCLPVNSRIMQNPSHTLFGENWCWSLITLLTILNDSIWANDYIRSYSTVLPYFSARILDKQKGTSRLSITCGWT